MAGREPNKQMRAHHSTAPELRVKTQVNQSLMLLSRLLMLNSAELEAEIEREIDENPALERTIDDSDPPPPQTPSDEVDLRIYFSDPDRTHERLIDTDSEESPWQTEPASSITLREHIAQQTMPQLRPELHTIATFLIEAIDDNGYLQIDIEEACLQCNAPLELAEEALKVVQSCDPAGVGARSLQECLALQALSALNECDLDVSKETISDAERIIALCWDDFAREKVAKISRKLKLSIPQVERAYQYIRHGLAPYPGEKFLQSSGNVGRTVATGVEPDVVIRSSVNGFDIIFRGPDPDSFGLNGYYTQQFKMIGQGMSRLPESDQDHIREYVDRAKLFLRGLLKRRDTMKRIVQLILQTQHNFILTGDHRFISPVTRSDLAERVGLHRSTIGRAVKGKFMQLPSGATVSMDVFFKQSARAGLLIEQIIREAEETEKRLSDEEIKIKLEEMGVSVSRRAVAKYRHQSKILSSRWR